MQGEEALLAAVVFAAIGVGLGLMMLLGGEPTRANRGIGSGFVLTAPLFPTTVLLADEVGRGPELLARGALVVQALAFLAVSRYVSGLAATAHGAPERVRLVHRAVLAVDLLSVGFAVVALARPDLFFGDFVFALAEPSSFGRAGFWVFAAFFVALLLAYMTGYYLLFTGPLDAGERTRAVCAFIASPVLTASQLTTPRLCLVCGCLAMLVTFAGLYRHAVAQGERAAFLGRFLSPHVAEQVRADGLSTVVRPAEAEVTVVACDLRGFTAYAEAVPSQAVIDLLGDYYAAVGTAVAEVDGTIKDYAGDGVLVLVGAPLPDPDHAAAGLRLADRLHEVVRPVLQRWATPHHPLGLGVGVASGRVTVGAIGSAARMEYTAVGTPVNLAARLCSAARDGEVLTDATTLAEGDPSGWTERPDLELKGLSLSHAVFARGARP